MYGALFMIVLLSACFSPSVAGQNLQECQESCAQKVPDFTLCNETCLSLSLQNISSAVVTNGSGLVLAVPDPPRLLNSTYVKFTLEWNDYATEELNATIPVSYILEVTRHKNITDSTTILPFVEKYHLVDQSPFTIPDEFVTKTFFSFRLAVITFYGTSNFSAPSPLYTTNNSCENEGEIRRFYPCPVTNLYVEYHVAPLQYRRPNISSIIHWDFDRADLQNVKPKEVILYVEISMLTSSQVPQRCHHYGLVTHSFHHLNPSEQNKSSTAIASQTPMYFGCPYKASAHLQVLDEDDNLWYFVSDAKFHIPFCFQGFCGCEVPDTVHEDSKFIHIEISSGNVTNRTTANVTWDMSAWTIEASYFRIVVTCLTHRCNQTADVRYIDFIIGKTSYSQTYHHLKTGKKQRVIVYAFDKDGCQHRPQRLQFDAVVPTTVAITTVTSPSSTPSIVSRHSSTATVSEFTTSPLTPTVESVEPGMSSATVAAITVPLVLLVLIGLAVLIVCRRRFTSKPQSLHRAPTGLQRLTSHLDDNVYHGNTRRRDSSSAYANEWDSSRLVVNLPTKSEGGLELNPAYVEQRIHDAMEAGETDEFEIGYHRLELKRVLGKGAFGKVFLAEAYGIGGGSGTSLVAVKVLNEKAHEDEMEDFKMEIEFMKTLGHHDNVVTMLGCCTLYPPMCLVVEYVAHGDLLHYLRNLRKTFEKHFNRYPLKDEAEKSKKGSTSNTLSQERSSEESSPHRHLVPSASDTALSVKIASCDKPRPKKAPLFPLKFTAARRPLRQCLSETKTVTNNNWIKKSGETTETGTNAKVKRSLSAASLKTLKAASAMLAARRASENPTVHYVDRNPADMSNATDVTLVSESPSVIKSQSLDGALDSSDLQSFAFQIANGMAYLSARGVVHRDLAARNILVGDDKVLKISDFGLSREGVYVKRSTGKIPLRWLSIEAMRDRIYSTASDIWAFGIVLWEICTLGGFPYPTLNDRDLLTFLVDGKRMNKPENCSDEIYQLMLACWSRECDDRPSFQSLRDQLENMQKLDQPYVNVDPNQEFHLPPTAGQDTAGNQMSFSDGGHSNVALTTDNEEDISLAHLHRHEQSDVESRQFSASKDLSTSRDIQNPCFESSDPKSGLTFTSSPAAESDKNLCFSPEEASFLSNKKTGESLV